MNEELNLLGCYVSITHASPNESEEVREKLAYQGQLFRNYIWGEHGICKKLKLLVNSHYGNDLKIVLFQFYVNPIPMMAENLKEIEAYRSKEKSIGLPILVNEENFFSKQEVERIAFLRYAILKKLELLEITIKKKKLDTNVEAIVADLKKILI